MDAKNYTDYDIGFFAGVAIVWDAMCSAGIANKDFVPLFVRCNNCGETYTVIHRIEKGKLKSCVCPHCERDFPCHEPLPSQIISKDLVCEALNVDDVQP